MLVAKLVDLAFGVLGARGRLAWGTFPNQRAHVLAFTDHGTIVGALAYLLGSSSRGALYVGLVWVASRYRRRGIASQMLALTEAQRFAATAVSDAGLHFLRVAARRIVPGSIEDARVGRERRRLAG